MSGRLFLASPRRLGTALAALVGCLPPLLSAPSAHAQSTPDTPEAPIAPNAPPVAPPAPDAPPPVQSEPGPPNQAPPITEPTPAPTPTPGSAGSAPKAEPPASAAFEPLPEPTREIAKPLPMPPSAAPTVAAQSAPSTSAAASTYQPQPEKNDDDDSGGLLGPFRIGVLVGTGLPGVANFGAQLKLTRFVGLGVNVGIIPTVKVSYYGEAEQSYQEYDAYAHIYPFGGSFFLGAGVGYVTIDGRLVNRVNLADLNVPGVSGMVDVTSDASVRTMVVTPQLGFLKIFDVGFAIGFDVGAQIPIAPSEIEFNTVAPGVPTALQEEARRKYINPNDEKVRSTLDTLGRTPLPTFNFKIGWFL